jgi:hypothetical protein
MINKLTKRIFITVAATLLLAIGSQAQTPSDEKPPPLKLVSMKIIPYNRSSDAFGEDISNEKEQFHLNELDLSLFVKVEVNGKPGSIDSTPKEVEITALEGKKRILSRTVLVGIMNEQGKYFAPAWIYGPICQPLTIEARIVGQAQPSVIKKRLVFQCGE